MDYSHERFAKYVSKEIKSKIPTKSAPRLTTCP